jgi:ferredoxin
MMNMRIGVQSLMVAMCATQSVVVALVGPAFVSSSSARAAHPLFSSANNVQQEVLAVSLEKPLGMILEEMEEGQPKGVFVLELADTGSAAASEFKDRLVGSKVIMVMGEDVTSLSFDDVMEKLINAPSPVSLEVSSDQEVANEEEEEEEAEPQFELGTPVTISVLEDGKETAIEAKVGDNLRQVLLENNIEVYKGLKKKLGNCGGSGQCTFCAADFVESEGWGLRSDYEDQKLKKAPNARLTCLNNIQGPATIRFQ